MTKWAVCGRKQLRHNWRYCALRGGKENYVNLMIVCPGWNVNQAPTEYRSEALAQKWT